MNSSYLRATHLENVPKKYENPKQQSSHNIREAEMGNVVTVNTKKTYRGLEVQLLILNPDTKSEVVNFTPRPL